MNNMDWLDSLTPQQSHLADMIIYKAKKEGVDPKLALALAFRESNLQHGNFEKDKDDKLVFKPTTGKSGEIGVMQIMPSTAKTFGYKPEDLNNLEKNMEIGIRILKSHMGKFNDPLLAAAAYNAGPNHPYFQDPEKSLPESTKQYLKDIAAYGGFAAPAAESEAGESVENAEPLPLSADIGGEPPPPPGWKEQLKEYLPAIAGAGAGAATGTTLAAGQKVSQGLNLLGDFLQRQPTAPVPSGDTSGTKWMRNWAGVDKQIAGGVPEASASYQRSKGQGKVTGQITKKFGPAALQPGGLSIQGQAAFPAPPPPAPAPSLLDDAVAKLGQIAKGALSVVRSAPVAGALGGAGAAMSGVEAFERGQKGDKAGAAMAGLGTLGALSAIPTPPTQAIGFGASVMSPLGLAVLDRMRKVQAEPEPPPASPQEMYQARQPAFTAQRP
jgi:hypothetical protein